MLFLSRKVGEVIIINGNIEVVVDEIRGGQVRLRIKAPLEVPVHRKEIQDILDAKKLAGAA